MYHHHQSPYNPYAAANPQYAPQYGNWSEQPQHNDPISPNSFSGSFHRPQYSQYQQQYHQQYQQQHQQQHQRYSSQNHAYSPHSQRPVHTSFHRRRTSVQQRWDEYIASGECSESLQDSNQAYINQVSSELEQRAIADERLESLQQQRGVDIQHAQQAERERRLKWAQEMIIQSPALCAEVYCAMSKRSFPSNGPSPPSGPAAPSAATSRSNSNSSVNSANSSNSGSPT